MMIPKKKLRSDQLAAYHRRLDLLKGCLALSHYPIPVMVAHCFSVVKIFYGSKAELAKELLESHRQEIGDWTAEELADFKQIEKDIEQMRRDEVEELRRDYTPEESSFWTNHKGLAFELFQAAQESEKEFDDFFREILAHRYQEKVIEIEGTKTRVYQQKSAEDILLAEILREEEEEI